MRESIRSVCYLTIAVAFVIALVFWALDRPDRSDWLVRIISPFVVVIALVVLYLVRSPADEVPDYLASAIGNYFDRGGFCFGFETSAQDGVCVVSAYFQNRHARPCHGRIALRPAKGFFLQRPDFEVITFDIQCEPAAFGVASVPIPVPSKSQGKLQAFEVGASVEYPGGKGRALRYGPGMLIRSNSNFGSAFHTGLKVAAALGGTLVLTKAATVTLQLPAGVSDAPPERHGPVVRTLWKLGDPLLQEIGAVIG